MKKKKKILKILLKQDLISSTQNQLTDYKKEYENIKQQLS